MSSETYRYDLAQAKRLIADALINLPGNRELTAYIEKHREQAHGEFVTALLALNQSYDGYFRVSAQDTRDPRRQKPRVLTLGFAGSASVELRFDQASGTYTLHQAGGDGARTPEQVPIAFDLYTSTFRGPPDGERPNRPAVAVVVELALRLLTRP